jgi:hypothetical protein
MKVEAPLCRKVEFSFDQICHPVVVWMTDSEIDEFSNKDLSKFDLFRLKASKVNLIEFRISCMKGWVKTNEIRHQESPIVLNTSISGFDRYYRPNQSLILFPFESSLSAVVYFKTDHGLKSLEFEESGDLKNLFNSSFTLFDDLIPYNMRKEISFESERIILIEYLFTDNH